jgi:hypothetical protein
MTIKSTIRSIFRPRIPPGSFEDENPGKHELIALKKSYNAQVEALITFLDEVSASQEKKYQEVQRT